MDNFLDEGLKSLDKRQKHIKVADRSDYGWATVEHYDSHPLADNSDDEKRLDKAEKEAERAAGKRRRGGGAGTKRRALGATLVGPVVGGSPSLQSRQRHHPLQCLKDNPGLRC